MGHSRPDPTARPAGAPRRPTVLIVDDDPSMRETLEVILRAHGYRILQASDGASALDMVRRYRVDVVVLDVHLQPGPDGFAVLEQLRGRFPEIEVIMCSIDREPKSAVRAVKLGAFEYLTKDFGELSRAHELIDRALARQSAQPEMLVQRSESVRALEGGMVVGQSPRMRKLVELVARVAPAPATVLIQGESGTGKELLARLVHRWSPRADKPFVAVNLAAVPAELAESLLFGHERGSFTGAHRQQTGKFEQAHGGTLFLDEIGDLPLPLQGKLLRAIQEREIERVGGQEPIQIDVRLVAATHVDLRAAAEAGRFRADLFYRLNVIPLEMPPLRERREEIPDLALFFTRKFAARSRKDVPTIDEPAMARIIAYDWPGNVRELENVIERLSTVCERSVWEENDLPFELLDAESAAVDSDGAGELASACDTFERNFIARALDRCDWNKAACARLLGISYATMKNKVAKYALVESMQRGRR